MGEYALAQAGQADILAGLIRRHIPLVQALAKRFSYSEDAFQLGCIGLVRAIRRFREDSGFQFSTYAVPVILGEMRKAFSGTLGWRAKAALNRAKRYQESVMKRTGKAPSIRETALHAGVSPEELLLILEAAQPILLEETPDAARFPDPHGENWLLRFFIRDILERMCREDSWLIRQRYILERSQREIALQLRIAQSTVSRKEKSARKHFLSAWNADQS